jgi:glucose/arabinose dehydrogenase
MQRTKLAHHYFVAASLASLLVLCGHLLLQNAAGVEALTEASVSSTLAGVPRLPSPIPQPEPLPPGATVETLLEGMYQPVAMAFDPSGRLFYTEKVSGQVRLFENGALQASPVITFDVNSEIERGLLGIAIDPDFHTNHYIYVYYNCSVAACGAVENRVVRFTESGGVGFNPTTIFTSTQTSAIHAGGSIHFGPDNKLYISLGDDADANNAQDVTVKPGKMHRINPDGTIPPDNPVFTQTGALPSLYAMGLRNSFEFSFDPLVPGSIFASENGPSCDDELNRIVGGYNYGWRAAYPCDDANPDPQYNTIPPLWYLDTQLCCAAPTGVLVYTGTQIPQWTGHLFMTTFNGGLLLHFYLDPGRTVVTDTTIVDGVLAGMALANGPDGALWYMEGGGYRNGILKRIVASAATLTATAIPTHTSTPVPPTVTRTPVPSPFLVGHLNWQGAPNQPHPRQQQPVTLTLKLGTTEVNYPSQTTDASGFFTVSVASLPDGIYSWRAKGPKFLANSGAVSLTREAQTSVEVGLMRTGDANNNNAANSQDFNILRNSFGTSNDLRADFNNDGSVNASDFNLLRNNFGVLGAGEI